ncbi:MAG: hypothetical protein GY786_22670 [Proteobacteria bacterium]|nr:hypothetical protein [Pseudomonadota bacterium]
MAEYGIKQIALLLISAFFIQSCSQTISEKFVAQTDRPGISFKFYQALDEAIEKAKVSNGALASIPGFPYLKIDRYHLAIARQLESVQQQNEWLKGLWGIALSSRKSEIANLPRPSVSSLTSRFGLQGRNHEEALFEALKKHSFSLLEHDKNDPLFFKTLLETIEVPDDYSTTMRGFGLYPLAAPIFAFFSDRAYDAMKERNQVTPDQIEIFGELITYSLREKVRNSGEKTSNLISNSPKDSFGLPVFTDQQKNNLAKWMAPNFVLDVVDEYDRIGEMNWEKQKLGVRVAKPTVYYYFSSAFKQGKPIVQINYAIWLIGRQGPNAPWIEKGDIDGLTLRVSLDQEGVPFLVDIMNSCGCYHFFVPKRDRIKSIIPVSMEFDPLVLDWLPDDYPEKPLNVRINSGWHQVDDIGTEVISSNKKGYKLLPYKVLESLPHNANSSESIFSQDGIVKGSDRIEPYLFFSMGVPDVGAMRQRGRHPIKLIGRSHFDDPYLIDKSFNFTATPTKKYE